METKPPTFEGDIDGVKVNSFLFQFESYFTFKGYDLVTDDAVVCMELGQCVRKSAASWYEMYVTNPATVNTRSAMKVSMEKNFKEPNFQQKLRNELLNFKQCSSYQGYVAKFQEKLRLVPLDPVFGKKIFLKELTSHDLKKQILRKKPETLEEVIAEGFSEVELERLEENKPTSTSDNASPGGIPKGKFMPKNKATSASPDTKSSGKKKCSHCDKGFQHPDNFWVKYHEKCPQALRKTNTLDKTDYKAKYFALIDKLVVDEVTDSALF
ncbi:hypothetical protein PHMEG_00019353 [Phytophthora megakarya]|uniref:Ty3 transposon capsid-like protein domain-containing protein n=1 Tax=Phytophthora megakarya TaxID=4795 RepID=A0A225VUB8_9STRA|nr:hypothetical protein PHMEG_00019353 [Phytophthora megakarya]